MDIKVLGVLGILLLAKSRGMIALVRLSFGDTVWGNHGGIAPTGIPDSFGMPVDNKPKI
jgi:hypothetical protein